MFYHHLKGFFFKWKYDAEINQRLVQDWTLDVSKIILKYYVMRLANMRHGSGQSIVYSVILKKRHHYGFIYNYYFTSEKPVDRVRDSTKGFRIGNNYSIY